MIIMARFMGRMSYKKRIARCVKVERRTEDHGDIALANKAKRIFRLVLQLLSPVAVLPFTLNQAIS